MIELLIRMELKSANEKFPPFASTHEGWAVLKEEVEESKEQIELMEIYMTHLWQNTRKHKIPGIVMDPFIAQRIDEIRGSAIEGIKELIQVAAMCDKFKALGKKEKEIDLGKYKFFGPWTAEAIQLSDLRNVDPIRYSEQVNQIGKAVPPEKFPKKTEFTNTNRCKNCVYFQSTLYDSFPYGCSIHSRTINDRL